MSEMKKKRTRRWVWVGIPVGLYLLAGSHAAMVAAFGCSPADQRIAHVWFGAVSVLHLGGAVVAIVASITADLGAAQATP